MSDITFQQEALDPSLIREAEPLTAINSNETDPFDDIRPGIKWDYYLSAQKQNAIRIYTARNGQLIGYAIFGIYQHPHYTNSVHASQDVVFIAPSARKGFLGLKFMRWCDEQLKKDGVDVVYQYASDKRDIGPVLKRLGYKHIQDLYARRLS